MSGPDLPFEPGRDRGTGGGDLVPDANRPQHRRLHEDDEAPHPYPMTYPPWPPRWPEAFGKATGRIEFGTFQRLHGTDEFRAGPRQS